MEVRFQDICGQSIILKLPKNATVSDACQSLSKRIDVSNNIIFLVSQEAKRNHSFYQNGDLINDILKHNRNYIIFMKCPKVDQKIHFHSNKNLLLKRNISKTIKCAPKNILVDLRHLTKEKHNDRNLLPIYRHYCQVLNHVPYDFDDKVNQIAQLGYQIEDIKEALRSSFYDVQGAINELVHMNSNSRRNNDNFDDYDYDDDFDDDIGLRRRVIYDLSDFDFSSGLNRYISIHDFLESRRFSRPTQRNDNQRNERQQQRNENQKRREERHQQRNDNLRDERHQQRNDNLRDERHQQRNENLRDERHQQRNDNLRDERHQQRNDNLRDERHQQRNENQKRRDERYQQRNQRQRRFELNHKRNQYQQSDEVRPQLNIPRFSFDDDDLDIFLDHDEPGHLIQKDKNQDSKSRVAEWKPKLRSQPPPPQTYQQPQPIPSKEIQQPKPKSNPLPPTQKQPTESSSIKVQFDSKVKIELPLHSYKPLFTFDKPKNTPPPPPKLQQEPEQEEEEDPEIQNQKRQKNVSKNRKIRSYKPKISQYD